MGKSKGGKGGVVINNASISGFLPLPEMPAYVASKHGVIGLTRSFGQPFQYGKDGIVFAAVCPYFEDTDLLQTVNKTLDPTLDHSKRTDKMSTESTVKGVMKILKDKINGSTLVVVPDGYLYHEVDEKIKLMLPSD